MTDIIELFKIHVIELISLKQPYKESIQNKQISREAESKGWCYYNDV